jgi:hypothetical protein
MPIGSRLDKTDWFLVALTGLLLARQVWWMLRGEFNPDEFENIQVTWLLTQGLWPGRDYFHPHMPLYNFLLLPILRLVGERAEILSVVRAVFFPAVLVTILEVFWIGSRLFKHLRGGLLATNFFLMAPIVGTGLAAMRADTVALPLTLAGFICLLSYFDSPRDQARLFYLAGLLMGIATSFAAKVGWIPLLALFFADRHHQARLHLAGKTRLWRLGVFCALCALPFLVTLFVVLLAGKCPVQEALRFLLNPFAFVSVSGPLAKLRADLLHSVVLPNMLFILIGTAAALSSRFWSRSAAASGNSSSALIGGACVAAVAQLVFLPALAHHVFVVPFLLLSLAAGRQLASRPPTLLVPLVAIVVAAANFPGSWVHAYYSTRNYQIEYVGRILALTPPDLPVLDGMSSVGLFRPLVGRLMYYRPGFLSPELEDTYQREVMRLLAGRRYGAVVVDNLLSEYAPKSVMSLIKDNYAPSDLPALYLPKQ